MPSTLYLHGIVTMMIEKHRREISNNNNKQSQVVKEGAVNCCKLDARLLTEIKT